MMKKIVIISAILLAIFLSAGCSEGTAENTTMPTLTATPATTPATIIPTITPVERCVLGSPIGCSDRYTKVVPRSETNSTIGDTCLVTVKNVTSNEERVIVCW